MEHTNRPHLTASRARAVVLAAWLVAVLLNGAVAYLRPGSSPDSSRYQQIAFNLAAGHGYSSSLAAPYLPDLFRAPAYPAFLALLIRCAGPNWLLIRLAQAIMLSLLVPLGWFITARCFDRATGVVCAVLAALYPFYWLYAGQLLSDGLASVLTGLAAAALLISLTRRAWPWALLAGAMCGLTCLVKPAMLLFPLAAAGVYLWHSRALATWLPRAALYLLGTMIVVAPWTVRNYVVTGRIVPVTAGKGVMLYQMARYISADLTMREYHEQVQRSDPRILAIAADDDPAVTLRLDRELTAAGLALIRSHRAAYLRTIAATPVLIWLNPYTFADGTLIVSRAHLLLSLAYFIAALGGAIAARRQLVRAAVPLAVIVYLSLVHVPIWSEPRQSLPGRLCLLVFVSWCAVSVLRRLRRGAERGMSP